jgi:hypothetical protein
MNIVFNYLYRDSGNYKKHGRVAFRNPDKLSTTHLERAFRKAFWTEGYFIASQARIPEVFFYEEGSAGSDDHCFHEFDSVELTSSAATDTRSRTVRQFLQEVQREAKRGWVAFDPHAPMNEVYRRHCAELAILQGG